MNLLRNYFSDLIIIMPTERETQEAWAKGVADGNYEWIEEGKAVRLTQKGQDYADHLIRTDPAAVATIRQLAAGKKGLGK